MGKDWRIPGRLPNLASSGKNRVVAGHWRLYCTLPEHPEEFG
jgi:hypothetical protein